MLSPPTAIERTAKARTWVRKFPSLAPLDATSGFPERIRARSVVVPPISTTTDVCPSGVRARAPIVLAAGPEKIVSTGNSTDFSIGRVPRITSYNVCYTKLLRLSGSRCRANRSNDTWSLTLGCRGQHASVQRLGTRGDWSPDKVKSPFPQKMEKQ